MPRRAVRIGACIRERCQLTRTLAIVEDFRRGDGPILQKELEANDAANKHTSYISGAPGALVALARCAHVRARHS